MYFYMGKFFASYNVKYLKVWAKYTDVFLLKKLFTASDNHVGPHGFLSFHSFYLKSRPLNSLPVSSAQLRI